MDLYHWYPFKTHNMTELKSISESSKDFELQRLSWEDQKSCHLVALMHMIIELRAFFPMPFNALLLCLYHRVHVSKPIKCT